MDPDVMDIIGEVYGTLCAETLFQNASLDVKSFLCSLTPSMANMMIRPTHVPNTLTKIWYEKVIYRANPRSSGAILQEDTYGNLLPPEREVLNDHQYALLFPILAAPSKTLNIPRGAPTYSGDDKSRLASPPTSGQVLGISHSSRDDFNRIWTPYITSSHQKTHCMPTEINQLNVSDHKLVSFVASKPESQGSKEGLALVSPSHMTARLRQDLGRGVIIKGLPRDITLSQICANVRGGNLERVDFREDENRAVVGIYFCEAHDALAFVDYVGKHHGIYWGNSNKRRSTVELIPASMGGTEPIKENIALAITSESATRCLMIENLPVTITCGRIMKDVSKQSRQIRPVFEICEVESVDLEGGRASKFAVIRMGSIGTALGARLAISRNRFYKNAKFQFLPDTCNQPMHDLAIRWNAAEAAHSPERLASARSIGRRNIRQVRYSYQNQGIDTGRRAIGGTQLVQSVAPQPSLPLLPGTYPPLPPKLARSRGLDLRHGIS